MTDKLMFSDLLILLSAFLTVMASAPLFILLQKRQVWGQAIREDGPSGHHQKSGTPTAGGVLILLGLAVGAWVGIQFKGPAMMDAEWLLVLLVTGVLGLLGLVDDLLKILKKHNKGVSGYTKLLVQVVLGLVVGWYLMYSQGHARVALFNWGFVDLGWLYPVFTAFLVTGTSNAVNLTDGLDGLAASCMLCALIALVLIATGVYTDSVAHVYPEITLLAIALTGATFGFLLFNAHPARLFMGDTGSLALGGALAAMCILMRMECWLLLLGGIFVAEALSVILQVVSFQTTGRRIFKMSPLHHHFELCGWPETRVVLTFLAVQGFLCLLAGLLVYPNALNSWLW